LFDDIKINIKTDRIKEQKQKQRDSENIDNLITKFKTQDDLILKDSYVKHNLKHTVETMSSFLLNLDCWFGFNNEKLKNTILLLDINSDIFKYNETDFNTYEYPIQFKIIQTIKKISFFQKDNVYLKFVNKLTNNRCKLIDINHFSNKIDKFFGNFFNNFGSLHNVCINSLFKKNNIDYKFLSLNENKNLKNALIEFQTCMINNSTNFSAKYTIANFITWFNKLNKNNFIKSFIKSISSFYNLDDFNIIYGENNDVFDKSELRNIRNSMKKEITEENNLFSNGLFYDNYLNKLFLSKEELNEINNYNINKLFIEKKEKKRKR